MKHDNHVYLDTLQNYMFLLFYIQFKIITVDYKIRMIINLKILSREIQSSELINKGH